MKMICYKPWLGANLELEFYNTFSGSVSLTDVTNFLRMGLNLEMHRSFVNLPDPSHYFCDSFPFHYGLVSTLG